MISEIIQTLVTYQYNHKKRFGNKGDGGYVVADKLGSYDCYISAGIGEDASFCRDFMNTFDVKAAYAFDGTVKQLPENFPKKLHWVSKNIGEVNSKHSTTLSPLLDKYKDMFIKMDIEGAEIPWLHSITEMQMSHIKQLVVEIHGVFDTSWGSSPEDKLKALEKITRTHVLVHVHGNTCSETIKYDNLDIPNVLELTFVRKTELSSLTFNTQHLPARGLDFSNKEGEVDYDLNFPPFVYPKYSYFRHLKEQVLFVYRMRKRIKQFLIDEGVWETFKLGIKFLRYGRNGLSLKVPVTAYQHWISSFEQIPSSEVMSEQIGQWNYRPLISIVTPVYNVDPIWLDACIQSVLDQGYPYWEFCLYDDASTKTETKECLKKWEKADVRIKVSYGKQNFHIAKASNMALANATGEFVALLDNDDTLAPHALFEVVKLLQVRPHLDYIYSDEDKLDKKGLRVDPFFKPDWSYHLFLSMMYVCHMSVFRRSILDEIGGFREGFDGSQDYDLVLRFIEKTQALNIGHIPQILYHWRKIPGSAAATVDAKSYAHGAAYQAITDHLSRSHKIAQVLRTKNPGHYRVKFPIQGNPKVSIIIPFRDQKKVLEQCIKSILKYTRYSNYEIILINNQSEAETVSFINTLVSRHNHIHKFDYDRPFNFAEINNQAAQVAQGEYLLFLNNDTEVYQEDWIENMLEYAQQENVGVVGCKLFYPNKLIQHAGVVMGLGGVAAHPFMGHPAGAWGFADVVREYSAVTAACMLVKKDLFVGLGGFDSKRLPIGYNDVDFCLRVRERGWLVIFTPFTEIIHHESVSRGDDNNPQMLQTDPVRKKRIDSERAFMNRRWYRVIKEDPYYNRNLTLGRTDYIPTQEPRDVLENKTLAGVNIAGFFNGVFGLAKSGRVVESLLARAGVQHNLVELPQSPLHHYSEYVAVNNEVSYPVNIICCNPDTPIDPVIMKGKYNIGFWYWELDEVPEQWKDTARYFDEVWVATEFLKSVFEKALPYTKVSLVQVPFQVPQMINKYEARNSLALKTIKQEDIVFLFVFDFLSDEIRKNPHSVIKSFKKAFPKESHRKLIIKSHNGTVAQLNSLTKEQGGDSRITLINDSLGDRELELLMNACDVYVSLHRGEGLGLTLAEAILVGKPVIATNYSGNLDFCKDPWFLPVDYSRIPVSKESFYKNFFSETSPTWADPNIDDAARAMQQVVGNLPLYEQYALEGRSWILENYNDEALAARLKIKLQEIFKSL